jgi:hypothetical protein
MWKWSVRDLDHGSMKNIPQGSQQFGKAQHDSKQHMCIDFSIRSTYGLVGRRHIIKELARSLFFQDNFPSTLDKRSKVHFIVPYLKHQQPR